MPATFVPLEEFREYLPDEMAQRARSFYDDVRRRRSVRQFSSQPVSRDLIETCLRAAGTAPSGANLQPWHFVVIADAALKHRIREAAEAEERAFYSERAPAEWLAALEPLGTDEHKPYLETAPYLIAVFGTKYYDAPDGGRTPSYYMTESVGLATGILITALHHAGLATLTHTPSPMGFLNDVLERPPSERPFVLLVVGYPAPDAVVPDIHRKPLEEIATFL